MFTGIVEELGHIIAVEQRPDSVVLRVHGPTVVSDASAGVSIAINGVCLTVTGYDEHSFTVDVMAETLARSSLGALRESSPVNLERAMRADGRFGGHIVQGHVDATTTCLHRAPGHDWDVVTFALTPTLARYVVHKGSITLDGVSLTVSRLTSEEFDVSLIPTTLAATTLGTLPVGGIVNVEVDVIAKYVERLTGIDSTAAGEPR
ncbi:Riboflavin synthase [Austwickia sp. TVS 96-490-7B]|uniref:riboflavin synthase n=1 Tax=Austwickia sp. TVS 96-490-7B TaxID=2830843 RepID=UPI001C58FDDA|nr:riboflavin synthase [Austwickia sp. TVS 96-490-7B]MBW3086053.1 Riboflavin synthase [Austwickia sp. TVS 96-490-7B]